MPKETNFFDSYSPAAIYEDMFNSGGYKAAFGQDLTGDAFQLKHVLGALDTTKQALQDGFSVAMTESGKHSNVTFKDILQTRALTRFVEASLVDVVRSAIEPNLVIVPNLFSRFDLSGPVSSIRINTVGPVRIGEIAEGGEYKEMDFEMDEEAQRVDIPIRKYGGLVRITEEALEMNMVGLIRMWMEKMGTSFAQHKEKMAIQMINKFGTVVFDAATPASSVNGVPTGRGIDGAQNGTMSLHDFFDFYAHLQLRGFTGDTLLINPMAWKMFMSNPETREIVVSGGVLATRRMPAGSYAEGWGTSFSGLGERLTATGNPGIDPTWTNPVTGLTEKLGISAFTGALSTNTNLSMLGASFNIPPGTMFPGPLKIIVTPYVGYRQATSGAYVTDLYLIDSSACGLLIQKEPVTIEEFDDPWRDIRVTKARERYGMAILEQGKSIAIAKNIVVDRNYVFDNMNCRTLADLDLSTAITDAI